jgi:hypothetical protein
MCSSLAVTDPKRLVMPRISSSGGRSFMGRPLTG